MDVVVAIDRTHLHMHRLKDSGGATNGELQLFNQSLHLFNLHFDLLQVGIIVRIGLLLHDFDFRRQLYYLFCVRCQLGLIVFQLEQSQIFFTHVLMLQTCRAHDRNTPEYLSHLQLQFVCDLHNFLLDLHQLTDWKGRTGQEGVTSAPVPASTSCLIQAPGPQAYMLQKKEKKGPDEKIADHLTCKSLK